MTTLAIVGAGPGVGAAVARRFGAEGFDVALISRTSARLDALAAELAAEGIRARGFAADVTAPDSVAVALNRAADVFGPIDVLQYSPSVDRRFLQPVLETDAEDLDAALGFSLFGAKVAVDTVLPGLRAAGRGTVLFVHGGSAVRPRADFAGTSIAFAAASAYAQTLHEALRPEGVHVAQLIVPGAISEDDPVTNPGAVASRLWELHERRDTFRAFHTQPV
ncbi:SDR family NAD(P)-dependent oxidoreductase [Kineosporia succinea]|uniref:NADP-dependent 3-hydroxy acid dehydrogenase YdfG n=1 Tax=Kineosporia succinea TaxID=84632 RepID=A0ABT9PCW6_9ACTN|nr:SDR family NAD(P)-dependent oxidoreductase [Kineosporia succinea]MDP9830327.1 NADP-dependent 3-hydroxy acid dehydrogenase YdfG [Kineosporia succinea]